MAEVAMDPAHRTGIVYATTRQGYRLPVIDVSHPAFAVPDDPRSLDSLRRTFAEKERQRKRMPKPLVRGMAWWMGRHSLLAHAIFNEKTPVLGGITTYILKLGAPNLPPPFDNPLDRRLAATPGVTSIRMRLQQLARLMSEALRPELTARPSVPLHLLNIGGGTALDSLNILMLLHRSAPAILARPISIRVLDPDSDGPEFGRRALEALTNEGPLRGLEVEFVHVPYNWKEVGTLIQLGRQMSMSGAIIAASTEGALFEYGDDSTVLANLSALHDMTGLNAVGGTVTRADPLTDEFIKSSRFIKLVPRSAAAFAALARQAGFTVSRVESALLSDQVLLQR
jgi:hypothetical protein